MMSPMPATHATTPALMAATDPGLGFMLVLVVVIVVAISVSYAALRSKK